MTQFDPKDPVAGHPEQASAPADDREPLLFQIAHESRLPVRPRNRRAVRVVEEMLQREYAMAEEYDKALDTDLDQGQRQLARDFRADHDLQATSMREELERLGAQASPPSIGQRLRARGRIWLARLRPSRSVMDELRDEEIRLANHLRDAASQCRDFNKTHTALQRGSAMAEHHAAFIRDYDEGTLRIR